MGLRALLLIAAVVIFIIAIFVNVIAGLTDRGRSLACASAAVLVREDGLGPPGPAGRMGGPAAGTGRCQNEEGPPRRPTLFRIPLNITTEGADGIGPGPTCRR